MSKNFSIEIELFDLRFFMFFLGIALNNYTEWDDTHSWIKKELVLGFLIGSISFSIKSHYEEIVEEKEEGI